MLQQINETQPAITCSKLTIETLEQGVNLEHIYFTPCTSFSIFNFEKKNAGWQISLLYYPYSMLTRRTLTTEIQPFYGKRLNS